MILTLIQALIFISYVAFIWIKFKKPLPSISESWYALGPPLNILFTFFCWGLTFTMCFRTGDSSLYFFSGAGLGFVGAATMFKEKDVRTVHFVGAVTGIIFGLFGIFLQYGNIFPFLGWAVASVLIHFLNVKNGMWWIEISAFAAIILGLLIG